MCQHSMRLNSCASYNCDSDGVRGKNKSGILDLVYCTMFGGP